MGSLIPKTPKVEIPSVTEVESDPIPIDFSEAAQVAVPVSGDAADNVARRAASAVSSTNRSALKGTVSRGSGVSIG